MSRPGDGEGPMLAPYRAPGARPVELRPLDPAEEWQFLAEATTRPRWPQMVFIAAYALVGVGMLLAIVLDTTSTSADWVLGLPSALYVMIPALSWLVSRWRHRRRRLRLEAAGYDLSTANELIQAATARADETPQETAARVVAEAARSAVADAEIRVDAGPHIRVATDQEPTIDASEADDERVMRR